MAYDPLHDAFKAFNYKTVGFDDMIKRFTDMTESFPKIPTFPPYNIKKTAENVYVIELAVAGFGKQDIELTLENGTLTVKGNIVSPEEADFVYKGIANRAFTSVFTLADTVEVKNADLINGMLKIWLERFIPESAKPKKIEINETDAGKAYVAELDKALESKKKKEKETV